MAGAVRGSYGGAEGPPRIFHRREFLRDCGDLRSTGGGLRSFAALFRKRPLNAGTFLTVLPQPLKPPAEIAEIEKRPGGKEGERIWEKRAGAGSYEGIRTYQPGDSMRDIHWKLSSKNDELLSRRYMEEGESGISFYLDVSGWKDGGWKEQSAFLRLAFTISREGISTDYVLEEILDRVQRPVKRPAAAGILRA